MSAVNKMAPIFAELNQELKEILSYWPTHAMDEQNGGFIGEVTCEGKQIENAEKGEVEGRGEEIYRLVKGVHGCSVMGPG